jgi:predicted HAD superfamily phosphohydrolase YqeG
MFSFSLSIETISLLMQKRELRRALFFDLDSTLMKSKSGKFAYKTLQFLDDLKSNFKLL